jgi:hypothetical protein
MALITEVDQGALDAVDALLDGELWKSDEHRLRQSGGDVHLHLDRHRVDPDEREGVQLGEHGGRS